MKIPYTILCSFYSCLLVLCTNLSVHAQCGIPPTSGSTSISTTTIINSYYEGASSVTAGGFAVTVNTIDGRGSAAAIAVNDLILIMQMQGADINTSNTDSYGDGTAGGGSGYLSSNLVAGYYEYANVINVTGSTINIANPLIRNYYRRTSTSVNSIQSFQVIRVPRYYTLNLVVGGVITAPAWNGLTGGVVVVDAANTLTFTSGSINVTGLGFRGGGGKNFDGAGGSSSNGSGPLTNTDYRFNSAVTTADNRSGGAKGEGIAGSPLYTYTTGATSTASSSVEGYINGSIGRGAPANGGGGGTDGVPVGASNNQYNTGGGGGGNAGTGGHGGSGWHSGSGTASTYPYGGSGGAVFSDVSLQRVIMGGGGGAGTANNSTAGTNEVNASGGAGGGIIICRAKVYSGTGSLIADGVAAPGVTATYSPAQTDAAGGGGAGGTIIVVTSEAGAPGLGSVSAFARGGKGGDMTTYYDHGPGGGGGGGIVYTNGTLASATVTGGVNGLTRTGSTSGTIDNAFGATSGGNGVLVTLTGTPLFSNGAGSSIACGVLPINLLNFSAILRNQSVDLKWQTGAQTNFSHFEIEYSTNGSQFARIGKAENNTTGNYQFTHPSHQSTKNFYRLKMVDIDGKFSYSAVIQININTTGARTLSIYPNPAKDYATLQLDADKKQSVNIQITDYSGRMVASKALQVEKGMNYLPVPGIKEFSRGIYFIKVSTTSQTYSEKLTIGTY